MSSQKRLNYAEGRGKMVQIMGRISPEDKIQLEHVLIDKQLTFSEWLRTAIATFVRQETKKRQKLDNDPRMMAMMAVARAVQEAEAAEAGETPSQNLGC